MSAPLLETRRLKAGYLGRAVVNKVNLRVEAGEVVCLLGPNGSGKTTTLQTIAGELAPVDGVVLFDNVPTYTPMYQRVRSGVGLVTEDRLIFTKMSARDNLRVGGGDVERALELFPELESRFSVRGGMLSGGEQQMLAIARALMTNPRLLILDEATEGLAPIIRQEIWSAIKTLRNDTGLAILIIDKSIKELRQICDRVVILEKGRTVWRGNIDQLSNEITQEFIGV